MKEQKSYIKEFIAMKTKGDPSLIHRKYHKYDNDSNLSTDGAIMTLFYDPEINRFIDDFGIVVHDIFRLITPKQLMLFRYYRNNVECNGGAYTVPDVTNSFLVEMVYPDEEEPENGEWLGYDYEGKMY